MVPSGSPAASGGIAHTPVVLLVALVAMIAGILTGQWTHNPAFGLADAESLTRLVVVRDVIDGLGWATAEPRVAGVEAYLAPGSPLVDRLFAGLQMSFRILAGPLLAEQLAIFLWPLALLGITAAALAAFVSRAAGPLVAVAGLGIVAIVPGVLAPFAAGRIDDTGVGIALLALALAAATATRRPLAGPLAGGLLLAAAVAVDVGNGTAAAVILVGMTVAFIFGEEGARRRLALLGGGLAAGALLLLAPATPATGVLAVACDSFSLVQAAVTTVAGLGLAGAATLLRPMPGAPADRLIRAGAAGAVAAACLATVAITGPECLGGRFAGVDPRVLALSGVDSGLMTVGQALLTALALSAGLIWAMRGERGPLAATASLAAAVAALLAPATTRPVAAPSLACRDAVEASLGARPAGLVIAPGDLGPFILAATDHRVLALPDPRAGDGLLLADDALSAPDGADRAAALGASYVAVCGNEGASAAIIARAPYGWAGQLAAAGGSVGAPAPAFVAAVDMPSDLAGSEGLMTGSIPTLELRPTILP